MCITPLEYHLPIEFLESLSCIENISMGNSVEIFISNRCHIKCTQKELETALGQRVQHKMLDSFQQCVFNTQNVQFVQFAKFFLTKLHILY